MRSGGVDLLLAQLRQIAEVLPEVEGRFFVDDDECGPSQRWEVGTGIVSVHQGEV